MRDAVLFYRSFADAVKVLPESEQLAALWAVIDYGLDGTEPADGIARAIWLMAKPLVDRNNQRYENGLKGGRPKRAENQSETKDKPKLNQSETKAKPKRTQLELLDELLIGRAVTKKTVEALTDWVTYKGVERRKPYKETGLKSLITQTVNNAARYGSDAVCDVIQRSIANQYDGICWAWLDEGKVGSAKTRGFNNAPSRDYDMSDLELKLLASN